jgi:hypothetical protein
LRTFIVAIMQEFIFALQEALHELACAEDGLAAFRNVELAHKSLRERKAIKR